MTLATKLTTSENIFFIIFFILVALVVGLSISIFRLLGKEKKEASGQKEFAKEGFILTIPQDFTKQLEKLIGEEIQKNIGDFKNLFQKTSEEIIKIYQDQLENEKQKVQMVISQFSQQLSEESEKIKEQSRVFNQKLEEEMLQLTKFLLQNKKKIFQETKNKISELSQAAKKELSKIQELNLRTSNELSKDFANKLGEIYRSINEIINKKVIKVEEEIKNYKKEKLKEIDGDIYKMLGEVAKKTIGKTIDLSDHEKLVMEALEKAKKEIFYGRV